MSFREFLILSRYAHGLAALLLVAAFCYHGALGLSIRSHRKRGSMPVEAVKRHRKWGPVLMVLLFLVYAGGLTIVYLGGIEKGDCSPGVLLKHPLHLANGTVLSLVLLMAFRVSKRIKGREPSAWRTRHTALGFIILALLALQALFGLAIIL
jgi:hypothetical protein